jgi:hypothetical protein
MSRPAPDQGAQAFQVPLPAPRLRSQSLEAALNAFVAEERTLDHPKDLPDQTTAQIGLYPHRGQHGPGPSYRPGCRSPATPPPD